MRHFLWWPTKNQDQFSSPWGDGKLLFQTVNNRFCVRHEKSEEFGTDDCLFAWTVDFPRAFSTSQQKSQVMHEVLAEFKQDHRQMADLGYEGGPLAYKRLLCEKDGRKILVHAKRDKTSIYNENIYSFFLNYENTSFTDLFVSLPTVSSTYYLKRQIGSFARAAVQYEQYISSHSCFDLPVLDIMLNRNSQLTQAMVTTEPQWPW